MTENATSSDVTSLPSWNSASLRRCSVSARASGDSSQFGQIRLRLPVRVKAQRAGEELRAGNAVAMPDCTAPFRWRGTCIEPITSVPPVLGVSAAPAEPSANAVSKPARICLARMSLPRESWSVGRFVHADGLVKRTRGAGAVPKRSCRWCQRKIAARGGKTIRPRRAALFGKKMARLGSSRTGLRNRPRPRPVPAPTPG